MRPEIVDVRSFGKTKQTTNYNTTANVRNMATVGISYVHGSVAKAKKADVEIVLHFGCFTPPHSDQNEAQNQSI